MQAMWKSGAVIVVTILTGCVLSIDSVVSGSDATFDPRLLGGWEEVSGSGHVVVSRATETTYAIEYTSDDGEVGWFEARLGRLGERLVLDVWPAPRDTDPPAAHAGLLISGHLLLALDVRADEIHAAILDPDSLLAALRAGDVRLAYVESEDRLILHGTTEELRSALSAHFARSGALSDPEVWQRVRGARHRRAPRSQLAVDPCSDIG